MSEDMDRFVNLLSEKVKSNLEVITPEGLGQDYFLRISMDKMPKEGYAPRISHRQASSEDRTVPRITCAPTLLGCFLGYATVVQDFINFDPKKQEHSRYKQGYYIYSLDFQEALRPNNKLVYDQSHTDEHWLVPYSEETRYYQGRLIGKVFITKLERESRTNAEPYQQVTFFIEINKDDGIYFGKNVLLKKGYWKIVGPGVINDTWKQDSKYKVFEIDKETYMEQKELSAGLLSFKEPGYSNW